MRSALESSTSYAMASAELRRAEASVRNARMWFRLAPQEWTDADGATMARMASLLSDVRSLSEDVEAAGQEFLSRAGDAADEG